MGKLNLIIGPMFSGKTTELIRIYNKYNIKKLQSKSQFNIMVINHKSDNRYAENNVCSHDLNKLSCISLNKLNEYYSLYNNGYEDNNNVILIDEAQFFDDLYDFCLNIVDNTNTTIYVFGLSGDFKREKFGQILDLIPIADNIKHLKAMCSRCEDYSKALFTMRVVNEEKQISVGGNEKYIAVCRDCYLNKNN